jgi:uncharacterized integral membrane protein
MFRFLIIIGLLVSLIILVTQNLQPISLVFFGSKTPPIPLAIWVISFVGAGFFTSLYLQAFTKTSRQKPSAKSENSLRDIPPSPPFPKQQTRTTRQLEEKKPSYVPKNPEPASSASNSITKELDWEDSNDDDWDIEQLPTETTTPDNYQYRHSFSEEKPPSRFEHPQQPKTSSLQGTIYSYTYREKEPETNENRLRQPNSVYDADYRVITPPYRDHSPTPTEEQEETDWL